ncbi:hypothetical protein GQ42DRAFT_158047 [Ramicandelaber brevisporus]|nr:hypothetical protein GQ42DRAFT_158047 [Ramicandelaber brevisporus]
MLKRCIAKAKKYKQQKAVSDIGVNSCSHRGVNRVLSLLQFILDHDFADDEPPWIGTTEDFDPEDEYIDMPELFLDDDSADCDFDFMPDITGSSKSKNTSNQTKKKRGYKTVQQYMANLSGIEVYRAMLAIVYTYDLLKKPVLDENYVSSMPMVGRLRQLGYHIRTPVVNIPKRVTQHFQKLQLKRQLSSAEKFANWRETDKLQKSRCQKSKPGRNSVLTAVQNIFKIWNLQYKHIERFDDYIRNGQRKLLISIVSDYVYDKFLEARAEQQAVSDLDVIVWAKMAGETLQISNFCASTKWIYTFKQHHSIVSRRVVKQVSVVSSDKLQRREAQDEERTASLREAVTAAGISNTLNVDETCLLHEKGNKRTLAISDNLNRPSTTGDPAIVAVPLDSKEEDWPAKKPVVRVGVWKLFEVGAQRALLDVPDRGCRGRRAAGSQSELAAAVGHIADRQNNHKKSTRRLEHCASMPLNLICILISTRVMCESNMTVPFDVDFPTFHQQVPPFQRTTTNPMRRIAGLFYDDVHKVRVLQ